jgi:hypothetical protein
LLEESSRAMADLFQHPFAAAGTQRGAFRNRQPAPLVIEKAKAEMGAADVDREGGMW